MKLARMGMAALLATCLGAVPAGAGEEHARASEVVEAFRHLVAGDAWKVRLKTLSREDLLQRATWLDPKGRETYLAGLRGAASLYARMPGDEPVLAAMAYEFDTEEQARNLVALAKKKLDEVPGQPDVKVEVLELAKGAGGGGKLPGFFARQRTSRGRWSTDSTTNWFRVERFVGMLLLAKAPFVDRKAQDAAVDHAAAFMRDPVAARKLPTPATPNVKTDRRVLTVRVVDPEGKPVPKAHAAATFTVGPEGAESAEGRCVDAVCRLRVPASSGFVRVWQARDAQGTPLPLAPSAKVPYSEKDSEVTVRLTPGKAITGRVVAADGAPVAGITVKATSMKDPMQNLRDLPLSIVHAEVSTDAAGRFELLGLDDAEYELALFREGGEATSEELRYDAGASGVEIRLHATNDVRLLLLDYQGKPVPFAYIRASRLERGGSLHQITEVSGKQGEAVLAGLDTSKPHHLMIDMSTGASDAPVAKYEQFGWMPKSGTIRLARGWTLHGTVHDKAGKPAAARLHMRDEAGKKTQAFVGKDGTFTVRGLPYKPLEVAAVGMAENLYDWDTEFSWPWTKLTPTDEPVVLTLVEVTRTPKRRDEPK